MAAYRRDSIIELSKPVRWAYLAVGFVFLGTGLVGLVLPVLPGFLFLIASLWAFSKSCPRMESWMLEHPRFGHALRLWKDERAISVRGKRIAVPAIAVAASISTWRTWDSPVLAGSIAILGALGIVYLATRRAV